MRQPLGSSMKIHEMERLIKQVTRFGRLTSEELQLLTGTLHPLHLNKGEHLLREGKTCRKIAYIQKGVIRVYMLGDGVEDTCYFLKENQFAVALESFNEQVPANESLQAVTDCDLLTISYDKMQWLYREIPAWRDIVARITEEALLSKVYQRSPLVHADAKTRYEQFLRDYGETALRIPLGYIASYIGITQQSLSRLRRELANG